MSSRVILFQIKEPKIKLQRLVETAQKHFENGEKLLIFVEDEKIAQYVDELLWKMPITSFLPHAVISEQSEDRVAITYSKSNLNKAAIAFNLCSTPLLIEGPFRVIYDFEDLSSPVKKQMSEIRFDAYKKARLPIEAR